MPSKMPDDFEMSFNRGGGMQDRSSQMALSLKNCSIMERFGGLENTITFSLSPKELNAAYQILRQNSFPHIRTNGSVLYDKSGESLDASWGKTNYSVGTMGTEVGFLWRKKWDNIASYLAVFQRKEEEKQEVVVPVELDASLVGKNIYVQLGGNSLFSDRVEVEKAQTLSGHVIPGSHQFYAQITSNSQSAIPPPSPFSLTLDTRSMHGLKISWVANQLVVEEVK